MAAHEFGHVADPSEMLPTVAGLGPVHAEEQQQILRREAAHRRANQGYRFKAIPHAIEIEAERELPVCEAPVELYEDLVIGAYKLAMESDSKGRCLLCAGLLAPRLVPLGHEQVPDSQDVLLVHQDVQVAELPERNVPI
jgi:hypothetical protein